MNTKVSTTSSDNMSVGQQAEAVADLLMGGPNTRKKVQKEETQDIDIDHEDDQDIVSTDDVDDSDEGVDSGLDDSDDTDGDAESDEDEGEVSWSSVLGVDETKLAFDEKGNVAGIKTKVDGKEAVVKMNDLIAGYQTNKYVTQKAQMLAAEKKQYDQQKQVVLGTYEERLQTVNRLTAHLESKIVDQFKGIDWQRLRLENPAEYVALQQDYQNSIGEMKAAQQAIAEDYQKHQVELDAQMKIQRQAYLQEQYQQMIAKNPTWVDDKKRIESMQELQSFSMSRYGFTADELKTVMDSRLIEVLKDAKRGAEGVKIAKEKMQKIDGAFAKQKTMGKQTGSKLDRLIKRAKTATGSDKRYHQTDAIAELLIGNSRKSK